MQFSEFIGNQDVVSRLQQLAADRRPFHAYIFEGADGVGKKTLACLFAQAILCENPKSGEPCEDCPSCRKVESGNHTDIIYITSDGNSVKDEQFSKIKNKLFSKPLDGAKTFLIVDRAETLTTVSQNKLLKTLEEPGESLIIILLAENAGTLLPTIASRAHIIRLRPVASDEIREFLIKSHGVSEKEAVSAAAFAAGCPGRAVNIIGDASFQEKRRLSMECARALLKAEFSGEFYARVEEYTKFVEAVEKEKEKKEKERIKEDKSGLPEENKRKKETKTKKVIDAELLDMISCWYRDVLLIKKGMESCCTNRDCLDELRQTAAENSIEGLYSVLNKIDDTIQDIAMNGNRVFSWKSLYLEKK